LRAYYHEKLAPASDVDLFIYGLDEEQAIHKIQQIETKVRDSILSETTTIRTKVSVSCLQRMLPFRDSLHDVKPYGYGRV